MIPKTRCLSVLPAALGAVALAGSTAMLAAQPPSGQDFVRAAARGDLAAVQGALSQGGDLNATDRDGNTALMESARTGRIEVVDALIAAGASLDAQNNDGWTAAMRAVFAAQPRTLQALVAAGARLDLANNRGQTALDIAVSYGTANVRPEIMAVLAEGGAIVPDLLIAGEPALLYAVSSLQPRLVAGLIKTGADPDATDRRGRPALAVAASEARLQPSVQSVAALIAGGANVNLRDAQGRSPLEYAVDVSRATYRDDGARKNHGVVVYMLASRGADPESIAAARKIVIERGHVLFDTMIVEGTKKAGEDAAGASPSTKAPPAAGGAAPAAGPPPAGCPAGSSLEALTSTSEQFQASLPIDFTTVRRASALIKENGNQIKVFLTNGGFSAQAMDSSMVIPVRRQGEVVVVLQFMNGGQAVEPGTYLPSAGFGSEKSIAADVQVSGNRPAGTVVTFVAAQASDSGTAAIVSMNEGFVCGTFDLKGARGELAGQFVAQIER